MVGSDDDGWRLVGWLGMDGIYFNPFILRKAQNPRLPLNPNSAS